MPEPENIDPNDLQQGPIRHESLPSELLETIAAVYAIVGEYLGTTLEQFEIGFMRDTHPEREVVIWCSITKAWLAYHEDYLGNELLAEDDEKKVVRALLAISMGAVDENTLGVPADVGRQLLACYDDPSES